MDSHPYHTYLFFDVDAQFYGLPADEQASQKTAFTKVIQAHKDLIIESYATLGLKAGTTFMLWVRGAGPEAVQDLVRDINHSDLGQRLTIRHSYFGISRPSTYSGRHGKPEQTMQNFTERLPYFVVYPFTKTTEWHQMSFEDRRQVMGEHVKVGLGYETIRQCLLYSYGIDDYEFVVSYEMDDLQKFQDLVIDMRHTRSRLYTQADTPIFAGVHKPLKQLMEWL